MRFSCYNLGHFHFLSPFNKEKMETSPVCGQVRSYNTDNASAKHADHGVRHLLDAALPVGAAPGELPEPAGGARAAETALPVPSSRLDHVLQCRSILRVR